jgi:hypothetical protein
MKFEAKAFLRLLYIRNEIEKTIGASQGSLCGRSFLHLFQIGGLPTKALTDLLYAA